MSDRYVFGRVEVAPAERTLRLDGVRAPIGARAFDVLLALIERHDRVVTKDELLATVWSERAVEENNVVVQVSSLRKLLGDEVIATIPGRGYRFIAKSAERPERASPAPQAVMDAPLFGREAEAADLAALLQTHRLVTLTGAGGVGKTRLARQHVVQLRNSPRAAWAELASLSDPSLVVASIAAALGLTGLSGDLLDGLRRGLKPAASLLVLDNAEHLVDEVARIARVIVDNVPGLTLLVTSQVPLGVPWEQVMRLGPLSVPEDGASVSSALTHSAVALFARRASKADRRFVIDDGNVADVIAVCRSLDGLPLAIEMAAARVPMLGVRALAAGLDQRLRLLTGSPRDAPARQQSLRAALEWSHALLTNEERIVFRRLAVFAGSFSLDMALEVAGGVESGDLGKWTVVDALGSLIDRSLLTVCEGDAPRYAMLNTPRAYALAQLASAAEEDATRRLHVHAVLAHFAQVDADHWAGRTTGEHALAVLSVDLDNARAAFAFAEAHDPPTAVSLIPSLAVALRRHGASELGRMLESTSMHVTEQLPPRLRAGWLIESAHFQAGRNPAAAAEQGHAAAAICRALDDRLNLFRALVTVVISDFNHVDEAQERALEEAMAVQDPAWSDRATLIGLWARARVQRIRGRYDAALSSLTQVIELGERGGDLPVVARARAHVAEVELVTGCVDLAVQHARDLAVRLRAARVPGELPTVLRIVAAGELSRGHLAEALVAVEEGWRLAGQTGREAGWADVLALLAAQRGCPEAAARLLGAGDADQASRDAIAVAAQTHAEAITQAMLAPAALLLLRSEGSAIGLARSAQAAIEPEPAAG